MAIVNLPQDIFPDNKLPKDEIIIHSYAAKSGSLNGKSILHTNAISLVIEGRKKIYFAEKTVVINDDEFHFLSSGNCLASIDLSAQKFFKSVLIFFNDKILADFYVKHDLLIRDLKKRKTIKHEPYIFFRKDEFIQNYISSLLLILKTGRPLSQPMKQLKFEELMLYLLEKFPFKILSFYKSSKSNDDLEIRKTVETNIVNNLTLKELAFLCNLSVSTFKRRFIKIYNTSPNKWLLIKKMEIAANLIRNHHKKPSDVFHELGYENHSSFTKSFKQVHGVTPKEYQSIKLNFQP